MAQDKTADITPGALLCERYRVTGVLGHGGFATVYEGLDEVLGRKVAIKVLKVQAKSQEQALGLLERFRREARAAAQIDHSAVVTTYDYNVYQGQPFIVMERLRGHDLAVELQQRGPMDPARLWPLLARALDGLGKGHQQSIVHKDLKPANLFLVRPGQPQEEIRVLDFGIARLQQEDVALTETGQLFGTARYFAPEYIQDKKNVSPALDVYQMGLILVELLTGTPAITADNALTCAYQHMQGQLDIPQALLDSELGPVLRRATALSPQQRYPDALALAQALAQVDPAHVRQALAHPRPGEVPPTDPRPATIDGGLARELAELRDSQVTRPPRGRALGLVAALTLGLVLLVALGGAVAWKLSQEPTPPVQVGEQEPPAPAPAEEPGAPEPEATEQAQVVSVELQVEPADAQVLRADNQELLGQGTQALSLRPGEPGLHLLIKAEGYRDADLTVSPQDAPRRQVRLEKLPEPVAESPGKGARPTPRVDPRPRVEPKEEPTAKPKEPGGLFPR